MQNPEKIYNKTEISAVKKAASLDKTEKKKKQTRIQMLYLYIKKFRKT